MTFRKVLSIIGKIVIGFLSIMGFLLVIALMIPQEVEYGEEEIYIETDPIFEENETYDQHIVDGEIKEHKINDTVVFGELEFKITGYEEKERIGDAFYGYSTKGKYVIVSYEVTNIGKETYTVYDLELYLIDSEERIFDEFREGLWYVSDDFLVIGEQLQPGLEFEGKTLYEVPKDTEDMKIMISDDYSDFEEVYIKLE